MQTQNKVRALFVAIGISVLGTVMYTNYQHDKKLHAIYLANPDRYTIEVNYGRGVGWKTTSCACAAKNWDSFSNHRLYDRQTGQYVR